MRVAQTGQRSVTATGAARRCDLRHPRAVPPDSSRAQSRSSASSPSSMPAQLKPRAGQLSPSTRRPSMSPSTAMKRKLPVSPRFSIKAGPTRSMPSRCQRSTSMMRHRRAMVRGTLGDRSCLPAVRTRPPAITQHSYPMFTRADVRCSRRTTAAPNDGGRGGTGCLQQLTLALSLVVRHARGGQPRRAFRRSQLPRRDGSLHSSAWRRQAMRSRSYTATAMTAP